MIHRKRPGFTLIELVTIVLIVGVHLAILFPLLEKSKEDGRKSTCQDNLNGCAIALQLYINDYDSSLPSSVGATSFPGKSPSQAEIVGFLTGMAAGNPPGAGVKSWARTIGAYFKDSDDAFCPSDTSRTRLSYWYKYAVDAAWRDGRRKEGDFFAPDKSIILYEHAGWHTGDAAGIKDGVTINVAFLDSHVQAVTVKNGPAQYPSAADETSGMSSIRLGEPMYFNYDSTTNTNCTGVASWTDPRRYYDQF